MRLGIILPPFAEAFEQARNYGVDTVEFTMDIGADVDAFEERLPQMKEASKKAGIPVCSIGRWGSKRQNDDGVVAEAERNIDHRLIDACAELGCPVFVCNFNFALKRTVYENYGRAIDYFAELIEYGRKKGVRIATYNCEWEGFVVRARDWRIVHGQLPELGIKFDPANSAANGCDYMKEIRDWGDRFFHVHLKGHLMQDGHPVDNPPAGMDDTNWPALISTLIAKGYDGALSIEPHSENWNGRRREAGIRYTVDYFRRLLF